MKLCVLGLHKWKPVVRYVPGGAMVYPMGIPCKTFHLCDGTEVCQHCKKRVKDRKDWFDRACEIAFAGLALGVLAVFVPIAWWMAKQVPGMIADVWRMGFS